MAARLGGIGGLLAAAACVGLAACTDVDQKYHLRPPETAGAYPKLLPRSPAPPEPVLSAAEQKAAQASLESAGKRVESIPPAHLQGQ